MSELTTGGSLPPNWGYPSPVYVGGEYRTDGMIWMGKERATEADIEALNEAVGATAGVDDGTLVGIYSPLWITFADKVAFLQGNPPTSRMGGLGSQNYENQLVGESDGALFRKPTDGDMWYTTTEGNLVYGIPPDNAGCYHNVYVGDGYYDPTEGVAQGSAADKILGRGEFYWDEKRRLYDVK